CFEAISEGQPTLLVTCSCTVYSPGEVYRLTGFCCVDVLPSPNPQVQPLTLLLPAVLSSVNSLSAPWQSVSGATVKAATGLSKKEDNVFVAWLVQPHDEAAISCILYEPVEAYTWLAFVACDTALPSP